MARRPAAFAAVVATGALGLGLSSAGVAAAGVPTASPLAHPTARATSPARQATETNAHTSGAPTGVGSGSFSGVASADAYRMRYAITNLYVIEDFVDGGGPSAQVALDSLGESTGFSSFPYPGATGTSLPGVISTLTGKSLPSYPFIVTSQYPSNPRSDVTQPGYRLHADSSETASNAFSNVGERDIGGGEIGGFAKTSVTGGASGLLSHAEATTHLKLNALTLSGVTALAEVKRDAQGKVTKLSSLTVASLTVGGIPIGVTDQGLVVGSTAVPLNVLGQVSQAVSRNGVTVKYLPATSTADSQMSAGLQITSTQEVPNNPGAHQVVTLTIGRAYAQGNSSTFATGTFPIDVPLPNLPAPSSGGATLSTGLGAGSLPSAPMTAGEPPSTTVPGTLPSTTSSPTGARLLSAVSAPRPQLSFYPILALAGLVVLLTSFGVRRPMRASA